MIHLEMNVLPKEHLGSILFSLAQVTGIIKKV